MGTAALQIIRGIGATSLATAGSEEKLKRAKEFGAAYTFNRKEHGGKWDTGVLDATKNEGVRVIMDCIGYPYIPQNARVIARDGRWILFGLMVRVYLCLCSYSRWGFANESFYWLGRPSRESGVSASFANNFDETRTAAWHNLAFEGSW